MPNFSIQSLTSISRRNDVCIPIRKCFSEGDRFTSHEPILLCDYPNRSEGSLTVSMIQWELFSFSEEELFDVLFYGSLRLDFMNCPIDYPLLNQKPTEIVSPSALAQIVEGADIIEELNKNMSNKWSSVGTMVSVVGCQIFPSAPLLLPAKTFCRFHLVTEKSIPLAYSLKIAVNLHGVQQTVIQVG